MNGKPNSTGKPSTDPDDAPELTEQWFEEADLYKGEKLVRRGRPKSPDPKVVTTIRLDADIVRALKKDGKGWQTRLNDTLRKAMGL